MRCITGVGEQKLQRYADDFLPPIQSFIKSNPQARTNAATLPVPYAPRPRKSSKPKGETFEITWRLLEEGLSCSQVAEMRGLTTGTVSGHIERLILDGRNIELDRHVEPARRLEIERLFKRLGTDSLREIVDASGEMISFEDARIVRAAMQANSDQKWKSAIRNPQSAIE